MRSANVSFSNGFLIGGDPPSFQSHSAGIAAFLGIDLAPGQQFNPSDIAVRFHDTSGRITKVIWSTTSIDVVIEGDALDESIIELASQKPGEKRNLASERCQKFSFNIPDTGLPPGSWLQLHRGGNLLDYKFLNWPYSLVPDSGVERVVEKNNEIQSLISQGEGPTVEFKEDVPTTNNAREKAIKTIAAFANGQGGKILFGVRDDGTVKGVPPEQQTRSTIDAMTNSIWDLAIPTPEFEVDVVPINVNEQGRAGEPKAVMVVTVHKGSAPPYGIKPNKPEFYVRRGSSTYHAPPDQIRSMVAQSLQTTRDFSAQGFLRY
ncbi:MAG: ATP-binding protein [Actinomycetota bacterium]|nr:ATP-binding protein [Actinomycetota bacterium]